MDRVRALAEEIRGAGTFYPPVLVDETSRVILDGHHRWHASSLLGLALLPCYAVDYRNDPAIRVPTLAAIADSAQLLARLWESAWREADVEVADGEIVAFDEGVIEAIYRSNGFLPALTLQQMADSEDFEPPV